MCQGEYNGEQITDGRHEGYPRSSLLLSNLTTRSVEVGEEGGLSM